MPTTLQTLNGIQVATLSGAFDSTSGADLITTIRTSVDKEARVVLDFTMVPQMDARGLRYLLELNQWFHQGHGRLALAAMSPEVWRMMEESSITDKFEHYPSRPAAMAAMGGSAGSPADDFGGFDSDSAVNPGVDSGIFSSQPSLPSEPTSDWAAPPAAGAAAWSTSGEEDSWSKFNQPVPSSDGAGVAEKEKSRTGLYVGLAIAVVLCIAGTIWLVNFLKVPEIQISESAIEVQEGQELPETSIVVSHGELDFSEINLPQGIDFSDAEESENGLKYYLAGLPKTAGSHTVTLHAIRGSRKAEPVTISIEVKEKKLEWLFAQPPMEEQKLINKTHYAKVVAGAKTVELKWAGEPLGGLAVREIEGAKGTWQLEGTPSKAGSFQAEFHAFTKSGKEETKTFVINVKGTPPPPALVVVVTPPPADPTTSANPTTSLPSSLPPVPGTSTIPVTKIESPVNLEEKAAVAAAAEAVDDRMRTFLMERIEKANSHFDKDKGLLREIVGRLKEARLVATIHFGNAQTRLTSAETAKLKDALDDPALKKFLKSDACQLLVVGYASTTGSPARNVKLSQQRAQAVNELLLDEIGRKADLCGDYGPTDIVSSQEAGNRVVEVYAGIIEISKAEQMVADMFKKDFNKRHGGGR